jgi:hypothetical protein
MTLSANVTTEHRQNSLSPCTALWQLHVPTAVALKFHRSEVLTAVLLMIQILRVVKGVYCRMVNISWRFDGPLKSSSSESNNQRSKRQRTSWAVCT